MFMLIDALDYTVHHCNIMGKSLGQDFDVLFLSFSGSFQMLRLNQLGIRYENTQISPFGKHQNLLLTSDQHQTQGVDVVSMEKATVDGKTSCFASKPKRHTIKYHTKGIPTTPRSTETCIRRGDSNSSCVCYVINFMNKELQLTVYCSE